MLTACGEDSAPSYRLQKIVEANQKSGKVYADMTLVDKESSANYVYAINGQNMYAKIQFTANNSMEVVVKDGKGYYKNQAAIATAMIAAAIFLSIFICRTSNVKWYFTTQKAYPYTFCIVNSFYIFPPPPVNIFYWIF